MTLPQADIDYIKSRYQWMNEFALKKAIARLLAEIEELQKAGKS